QLEDIRLTARRLESLRSDNAAGANDDPRADRGLLADHDVRLDDAVRANPNALFRNGCPRVDSRRGVDFRVEWPGVELRLFNQKLLDLEETDAWIRSQHKAPFFGE